MKKLKPVFLALVGPNAAGKTSLAKNLANHLGWPYLKSPPKQFWRERNNLEKQGTPEDRYKFYLKVNKHLSNIIQHKLNKGLSVILDRYYLDTLVTHLCEGVKTKNNDFAKLLEPTLTILVCCSVKKQLKRLTKRSKMKKLSAAEKRHSVWQIHLINKTYQKMSGLADRVLKINTDQKTKEQNLVITLDALKKLELIP